MTETFSKLPISIFIICKNEEDRIAHAIKSVREFASEIIVVDSGSTDKTLQVAQDCGADQILFRKWEGYGQQKRYAESICAHDWILNIDADEEVSPKMQSHIREIFEDGSYQEFSAFKVEIKFWPRFKKSTEDSILPSIIVPRLYNKKYASFKDSTVFDSVELREGKCGLLRGCLIHRCFRSFTHAIDKINYYSSMQAEDAFARGKEPPTIRIIFEPIWTFMKSYFAKKYIFLGTEGLLMALLYSIQRTIRLIKIKEKFLYNRRP